MMQIREREIELKLRKATADRGGLCLKCAPQGWVGAPDRMVLLPQGRMGFVEVKAPGQRPRPLQVRRHAQLAALGYVVVTIDHLEQIKGVLDLIEGAAQPPAITPEQLPAIIPKHGIAPYGEGRCC